MYKEINSIREPSRLVPDVGGLDLVEQARRNAEARRLAEEERLGEIAYMQEVARFSGGIALAEPTDAKRYTRNLFIDRR